MRIQIATLARPADVDLSDLTTANRVGPAHWVDDTTLEIPFDRELTTAETAAIRNRLITPDASMEQVRQLLADYIAKPTTTPADDAQALKLMARAVLAYFDRPPS